MPTLNTNMQGKVCIVTGANSGKYYVKSVPVRSAPVYYDESLQRQAWEETIKLVNLPPNANV